jgi:teichuronic acid biosynthesis glycosyltransferase TuaC
MRVLIVCSGNAGAISPFVKEQAVSLEKFGVNFDYFLIIGKGVFGYLKNYRALQKKINSFNPDFIHAHYGFSGFLACLQRKVKVITTFHGSDINPLSKLGHSHVKHINMFSFLAIKLSIQNIFVSDELLLTAAPQARFSVIPCGVNLNLFIEMAKAESRDKMHLIPGKKYALFASSFNMPVKNYPLAKRAIELVKDCELIEMKGFDRNEVTSLMNACDFVLVTSRNESGPLVVKEAMACNCPLVSTDVGDVREVIGNTEGCYICSFEPEDVAEKIKMAIAFAQTKGRTNGRERIIELGLDSVSVAKKILKVYEKVI